MWGLGLYEFTLYTWVQWVWGLRLRDSYVVLGLGFWGLEFRLWASGSGVGG